MRARQIVVLRVTFASAVVALALGAWIGLFNAKLLFLLIPPLAAVLTMWMDQQKRDTVILRAPRMGIGAADLGRASADTTVWPNEDQKRLHEYAILCANSYRRKQGLLPPPDGWEELARTGSGAIPEPKNHSWRIKTRGLHWEIWADKRSKPHRAAVVFRGTEFSDIGDWVANARWLLRAFTWDQYAQVRALTPEFLRFVRKELGDDVEVIATGHSLGGGLAQQLAYGSGAVDLVYAFQSSPVTGYHGVPRAQRDRGRQGLRIYRVFEHGEVLAYLRWILRAIVPLSDANPKIVEARFDFEKGGVLGLIRQHDMRALAIQLTRCAESNCGTGPLLPGSTSDTAARGPGNERATP